MRMIQWVLLLSVPLFAGIAEIIISYRGTSDWGWRHWLLVGYAAYGISVALRFRNKLFNRAIDALQSGRAEKAGKSWEAGNLISFAIAENVTLCGLLIRFVLRGAFWQAALFYTAGIFLLLLWTPRLPTTRASN